MGVDILGQKIGNRVVFLGTGGARIVMAKQLLQTGGIWVCLDGVQISLDPGPGALVYATAYHLDPSQLDAVLISHRHLDHCGDVNAMVEAMTAGGLNRHGVIMAPKDALTQDPVLLRYVRSYAKEVIGIDPYSRYQVGDVTIEVSMPHDHGSAETYGFNFVAQDIIVSYVPDTSYFRELSTFYRGDILIISMLRLHPEPSWIKHLALPDVIRVLNQMNPKPKRVLLTHFGRQLIEFGPDRAAKEIGEASGVQVLAAHDGEVFDLDLGLD